jgi:putative ABC transport system ATP-binding protein
MNLTNTTSRIRTAPDIAAHVIASARGLVKTYGTGDTAVQALAGIDVDFARGELTAIMGPSGSGKSTLMHCMAGLDTVTSGTVVIDGEDVGQMSQRQLTRLRRTRLGFIFKAFNPVPTLTAAENITLPLDIARCPVDVAHLKAIVAAVGLEERLHHRPSELSGGQQQRVACARALVAKPAVIFADEPTGNLDSQSSAELLGFLRRSVDDLGQTVVMVTHDPRAATYAHRVLFLADGLLVGELTRPTQAAVLEVLGSLGDPRSSPRQGGAPRSDADEKLCGPAIWQNCGVYSTPVPNEQAVHSLEHGAMWITYRPGLPAADLAAVQEDVSGEPYALVSPYPGLPSPIVASAWGVQLRLTAATDPRLKNPINTYKSGSKAPEPGGECTGGAGTPKG